METIPVPTLTLFGVKVRCEVILMDAASASIIASVALDVFGSIIDPIVEQFKRKATNQIYDDADEVRKLINKAARYNSVKAENLANQLSNLQFIKKTPATRRAIDQAMREVAQEQWDVSDEYGRLSELESRLDLKANQAMDQNVFNINKKADEFRNKEKGDLINETEKILKKYTK